MNTLVWDEEALAIAGISAEQLPEVVPTTTVLPGLTDDAAASMGLLAATLVVVGGVVLGWAGDSLAPDLTDPPEEELLALAARVAPGSGGLLMLPYLLSERAPHWSSLPRGAYVGLTRAHRREHLVRAAIEGVCLQLALVLHSMRSAGLEVNRIRATGGVMRSRLWRQLLADTFGMPVEFAREQEGSGFGAALLGMEALGLIESIDVVTDMVQIEETVRPQPAAAAVYASLLPVFSELYNALVPTFASLRRLAPLLPIDLDLAEDPAAPEA